MKAHARTCLIEILLIEDSPGDVRLIAEFLKKGYLEKCQLTVASRLSDAIEKIRANQYDIILSDLCLPDSDGSETFRRLLAEVDGEIPILVLTGSDDDSQALEAIQQGAQDYITKDRMNSGMLRRVIQYAIERHRLRKEVQKRELQIRRIIEENMDGMVVVDGQGLIHFVNPAAETLLGRSRKELLGTTFGYRIGVDEPLEITLEQPDGEVRVAEIGSRQIAWKDEEMTLAAIRDITLRKAAEEMRAKNQSLEKVQQLAGAIAHEFSQPLQILNHSLEIMKLESNLTQRIDVCQRANSRIINLVSNLRNIMLLETQPYLDIEILDLSASAPASAEEDFAQNGCKQEG